MKKDSETMSTDTASCLFFNGIRIHPTHSASQRAPSPTVMDASGAGCGQPARRRYTFPNGTNTVGRHGHGTKKHGPGPAYFMPVPGTARQQCRAWAATSAR